MITLQHKLVLLLKYLSPIYLSQAEGEVLQIFCLFCAAAPPGARPGGERRVASESPGRAPGGSAELLWLGAGAVARKKEISRAVLGLMMKFCKNLDGPCPAPTYLPTYLPYLWETKKEITGWVKVGYYTN